MKKLKDFFYFIGVGWQLFLDNERLGYCPQWEEKQRVSQRTGVIEKD